MSEAPITTRETVRAHYGQPSARAKAKQLTQLDQHARAFIGLSPGTSMSTDPSSMPRIGSQQGLNTHNSEPMPNGMLMRNNGLSPGSPMTSSPNRVPQTGSSQGLNTHNSEPMPSGMVMPNAPTSY